MTFYQAVTASVEWRVIAYTITVFFALAHGSTIGDALAFSLGLQVILFMAQAVWLFLKTRP